MKTLVQITAQYYENYALHNDDYNGVPSWKPKGGQVFTMRIDDTDNFFYYKEECVAVIKELLQEESNNFCRYEYIEHEIIFHEPVELTGFDEKLEIMLAKKYSETSNQ